MIKRKTIQISMKSCIIEKILEDRIKQYLDKTELSKVPETVKGMLNERIITMMELTEAIKRQKNNNTPGPDGLLAELYKYYKML